MTKIIKADAIDLINSEEYDAFVHGCNCFCTMNSGIAKALRNHFPGVYEADLQTTKGDRNKLGSYTKYRANNKTTIYNLYTQYNYGYDSRCYLDYEALNKGLLRIGQEVNWDEKVFTDNKNKVLLPWIGCGLAGGDKERVLQIIECSIAVGTDVTICEL